MSDWAPQALRDVRGFASGTTASAEDKKREAERHVEQALKKIKTAAEGDGKMQGSVVARPFKEAAPAVSLASASSAAVASSASSSASTSASSSAPAPAVSSETRSDEVRRDEIIESAPRLAEHIKSNAKFIKVALFATSLLEDGRVTSHNSEAFFAVLEAGITGCQRIRSKVNSCLLPPASCLLPPASCLLPLASCLLPPTSCLLFFQPRIPALHLGGYMQRRPLARASSTLVGRRPSSCGRCV